MTCSPRCGPGRCQVPPRSCDRWSVHIAARNAAIVSGVNGAMDQPAPCRWATTWTAVSRGIGQPAASMASRSARCWAASARVEWLPMCVVRAGRARIGSGRGRGWPCGAVGRPLVPVHRPRSGSSRAGRSRTSQPAASRCGRRGGVRSTPVSRHG